MYPLFRSAAFVGVCALLVCGFVASPASAQTRINDKDLGRLMENLRNDAKSFRPIFGNALKVSAIRKTSRAKDAKQLVETFARQTDGAWKQFKQTKRNNVGISAVSATAQQIDALVNTLQMSRETVKAWERIKIELHDVEDAFGIPPSIPVR